MALDSPATFFPRRDEVLTGGKGVLTLAGLVRARQSHTIITIIGQNGPVSAPDGSAIHYGPVQLFINKAQITYSCFNFSPEKMLPEYL